jgi:hypothetical protein
VEELLWLTNLRKLNMSYGHPKDRRGRSLDTLPNAKDNQQTRQVQAPFTEFKFKWKLYRFTPT